jgi:hypothetical protein
MNKASTHRIMIRSALLKYAIWLLKGNLFIWVINGIVLPVIVLSGSSLAVVISAGYFSKITLLETGVVFLIGGAIAFSGSILPSKAKEQILKTGDQWSMEKLRKREKKANMHIVLAVLLFLESLLISFLGF